jgi:methionyl aminopeptidase
MIIQDLITMAIRLKSPKQIENIRYANKVLAEVLVNLREIIKPGITPIDIDRIVEEHIEKNKCKPSFKGWQGFPTAACVSVNEAVIHGIPTKKPLEEGDIVGVDIGSIYEGGYGDTAYTFAVGDVTTEIKNLMHATYKSLFAGIQQSRHKNRVGDIGNAIESVINPLGYGIVQDYCGHGVGFSVWEEPKIVNYGKPRTGPRLFKNMVIAIEPMINLGTEDVNVRSDKWTVVTADGKPSAHFEHSLLITDGEPEILSKIDGVDSGLPEI